MTYHAQIRRTCGTETCPAIDRAQGRMRAALAILERADREIADNPETAARSIGEAAHALHGEADELEKVRDTAGAMRDALAEALARIAYLEIDVDVGRRAEEVSRQRAIDAEAELAALLAEKLAAELAADNAAKYGG